MFVSDCKGVRVAVKGGILFLAIGKDKYESLAYCQLKT